MQSYLSFKWFSSACFRLFSHLGQLNAAAAISRKHICRQILIRKSVLKIFFWGLSADAGTFNCGQTGILNACVFLVKECSLFLFQRLLFKLLLSKISNKRASLMVSDIMTSQLKCWGFSLDRVLSRNFVFEFLPKICWRNDEHFRWGSSGNLEA